MINAGRYGFGKVITCTFSKPHVVCDFVCGSILNSLVSRFLEHHNTGTKQQ